MQTNKSNIGWLKYVHIKKLNNNKARKNIIEYLKIFYIYYINSKLIHMLCILYLKHFHLNTLETCKFSTNLDIKT
jgi:hypothetical protein